MSRSFTFVLLLIVCLLCIGPLAAQDAPTPEPVGLRPDAPQYALHGPYWVGTQHLNWLNSPVGVDIWYPAVKPDGQAAITEYEVVPDYPSTPTVQGHALDGGEPNLEHGPYPLIVLAHGLGDYRICCTYLAEHLASEGFVVMATDYPDWIFSDDSKAAAPAGYFVRPATTSALIDYAQDLTDEGGKLQGVIDPQMVAVIGYSLGGATALSMAGGQLDFSWLTRVADETPDSCTDDQWGDFCGFLIEHQDELAAAAGLDNPPNGLWPAWSDARLDALIGFGPAGNIFSAEGLQGISAPSMLLIGTADEYVDPDVDVLRVYDELPSDMKSLIMLDGAAHHVYRDDCEATPWLAEADAFWACSDPVWDMDRAHDLINHFTTAFLLSTLKGDADATAALSPDAVTFPGVEYQSEGF